MGLSKTKLVIIGFLLGGIILGVIIVPSVILGLRSRSKNSEKQYASFYVVPLGTKGGLDESDLSCYLVTSVDNGQPNSAYITLDGGTLRHGIDIAIERNRIPFKIDTDSFIKNHIQAYLISHGHLDHISGLILNNPNDKAVKLIVGLNETIDIIQKYYFNGFSWADFGPFGIKTYDYLVLDPLKTSPISIPKTDFNVRIYRLCHTCPYLSSAFLISRRNSSNSILYLGDTGPDHVESILSINNQTNYPRYLEQMWNDVRPLVIDKHLKAIFIEVSYPNGRPDNLLFGHLTPDYLIEELRSLKQNHSLKHVRIVVTHIKPDKDARNKIIDQLTKTGGDEFTFVFPQQSESMWL